MTFKDRMNQIRNNVAARRDGQWEHTEQINEGLGSMLAKLKQFVPFVTDDDKRIMAGFSGEQWNELFSRMRRHHVVGKLHAISPMKFRKLLDEISAMPPRESEFGDDEEGMFESLTLHAESLAKEGKLKLLVETTMKTGNDEDKLRNGRVLGKVLSMLAEKKAKLGSGARFKAVEKAAEKSGARNPAAVAAAAGIKAHGKKRMMQLAKAGKKKAK